MNSLVYAYIGDAIYELYIRKYLVSIGLVKVNDLQKEAIKYVSAKNQAIFLQNLLNADFLLEEEINIIKTARNSKSNSRPKNTDIITYKHSTALEALIGHLYLENNVKRMEEIINFIIGE